MNGLQAHQVGAIEMHLRLIGEMAKNHRTHQSVQQRVGASCQNGEVVSFVFGQGSGSRTEYFLTHGRSCN